MEISILNILICVVSIVAVLAWFLLGTLIDKPLTTKQSIVVSIILLVSLIIGSILSDILIKAIWFRSSTIEILIGAILGIIITIIIALVMNNKYKKLESETK